MLYHFNMYYSVFPHYIWGAKMLPCRGGTWMSLRILHGCSGYSNTCESCKNSAWTLRKSPVVCPICYSIKRQMSESSPRLSRDRIRDVSISVHHKSASFITKNETKWRAGSRQLSQNSQFERTVKTCTLNNVHLYSFSFVNLCYGALQ